MFLFKIKTLFIIYIIMTSIVEQITSITKENEQLKEENNKLKEELKNKTNTIDNIPLNEKEDYIKLINTLICKIIFLKSEHNKLAYLSDILYTYYDTAKLLNPNLLKICKKINNDQIPSYFIKYKFPTDLNLSNEIMKDETMLMPIIESKCDVDKFKDIKLEQLNENSKFDTYENRLFNTKEKEEEKEENKNDDIKIND